MQARSTAWVINAIRDSAGARMVTITLVPGDKSATNFSAFPSSRFTHPVSWYRNAKKTKAQKPKPARCHLRGFSLPRTQRPKIAEMVVSLEPSKPIQPPCREGRRFSGSSAVAQNVTTYNSNGNWNCRHHSFSFLCKYRSVPAQTSPKKNAAPACQKYRVPKSHS